MGISRERKEQIEKFLSEKNLRKYLPKYSANYIATELFAPEFITTAGTVIERARSFGLTTHTFSSARKLKNTQKIYRETCYDKYGVTNVSKVDEIKKKKENSAIEKYGVRNVFQSEEIKQKSVQTCIEKYGVPYYIQTGIKSKGRHSKFQIQVESILDNNKIYYESEVSGLFCKHNDLLGKTYSPIVDILLREYKIVIECYGDFWHANPRLYKPNDIFNTYDGSMSASEIWQRDNNRINQIESFEYKVIIVWEMDYNININNVEKVILDEIENQKNNKT